MPEHAFWPDHLQLEDAINRAGSISGHKQINDAYLLGLALANGGIVATFDRGVLALPNASRSVELIPQK